MRVKLNYDQCTAPRAFCRQCLHRFLHDPAGLGHYCPSMITEQDGSAQMTLEVTHRGRTVCIEITPETRDLLRREGWYAFVTETP
jgi:hypothetical protein